MTSGFLASEDITREGMVRYRRTSIMGSRLIFLNLAKINPMPIMLNTGNTIEMTLSIGINFIKGSGQGLVKS
ncbi:MAG: hypothetical protein A2W63_03170 [Deltaproteobacteria bacterium RIFCSPLOWO2_02_44_9]|nr:MAG: hypothetical protein A2W63_03170 [Deltaproteobacteria bacterium RIFCSPLOWO2_02_44_9]